MVECFWALDWKLIRSKNYRVNYRKLSINVLKLKSWPIFPLHDVICLILLSFISLGTADIVNIYWNKEQLCRKITKTMSYYVPFQQGLFMVYFVYPFYCIHTGDVDTSTWPRLFRTAVPFRTDVIWGWYLGMVFGVVSSLQYEPCVHILYIFNNVPICCGCLYLDALCDHLTSIIRSIDQNVERIHDTKCNLQQRTKEIEEKLHEMIKLHAKIFE